MGASNADRQKAYRKRRNVTASILRDVTAEQMAAIDAWAVRNGIDQPQAFAQLVARGLLATEGPRLVANAVCRAVEESAGFDSLPPPRAARADQRRPLQSGTEAAPVIFKVQLGPTPRKPGSMLKKGRG